MPTSAKFGKRAGYALHVMTASGAVAGLLALQSIIDNNIRAALLWLIVLMGRLLARLMSLSMLLGLMDLSWILSSITLPALLYLLCS